ncbi:MAG: glycosyltransferase family 2 protein [Bacteroidota bacterium]
MTSGACMMIRAELFRTLGGFDEDFFAHMEEIDLCWRMKRMGLKTFYVGSSTVYHVGGGTLAASNPRKTYYNFRNGLDMLIKNEPGGKLFWMVPFRILLDWLAALNFLLKTPTHALAVFKAHLTVLARFGRTLSKRGKIKSGYAISEIYPHSMIWRYFIRGKKTYQ